MQTIVDEESQLNNSNVSKERVAAAKQESSRVNESPTYPSCSDGMKGQLRKMGTSSQRKDSNVTTNHDIVQTSRENKGSYSKYQESSINPHLEIISGKQNLEQSATFGLPAASANSSLMINTNDVR